MLKNREQIATICLVGFIVLWAVSYISLDHTDYLKYSDICKAVPTIIIGVIAASIAWRQKEIAEDKHRLELFEKRFETYDIFLNMALWATKISLFAERKDSKLKELKIVEEKFNENKDKFISLGEQARFLFSEDTYIKLNKARESILQLEYYTRIYMESSIIDHKINVSKGWDNENPKDRTQLFLSVGQFYTNQLPEIMGPYLKTTPYISNK